MNREKLFAILRIAFGCVWGIDAWLKWQPSFIQGFTGYLSGMTQGQPAFVQSWIGLWVRIVSGDPHFFAVVVAIIETLIAVCLILGICTRTILVLGAVFSLIIWSTAEGFGGPYVAGSTDIGCAIIYAFVFAALFIGNCSAYWSLDSLIAARSQNK